MQSPIRAISFQPDSAFHGLEGLKHMETAIVPPIYDPSMADSTLEISTEAAYDMVKRIARTEGAPPSDEDLKEDYIRYLTEKYS